MGSLPFTYLGLPLSNKAFHKSTYLPLIHRLNSKLAGWAAAHLSVAGRIVLLNAVLSSLPTYYMTVMRLPQWVIKAIDKIRRHFLWHGVSEQSKKIHLANWELVTTPKSLGGLGVPDLGTFNSAILMKWQWNWQKPARTLWNPIKQDTVTVINFIPQAPLFTKTLAHVYDFYNMSTIHKLGNRSDIAFWTQNWGSGSCKTNSPICSLMPWTKRQQ